MGLGGIPSTFPCDRFSSHYDVMVRYMYIYCYNATATWRIQQDKRRRETRASSPRLPSTRGGGARLFHILRPSQLFMLFALLAIPTNPLLTQQKLVVTRASSPRRLTGDTKERRACRQRRIVYIYLYIYIRDLGTERQSGKRNNQEHKNKTKKMGT